MKRSLKQGMIHTLLVNIKSVMPLEEEPSVPLVLDIEASGFGRGSYPIEVGFVLADGTSHCRLIKPESDWTHWDAGAQELHGIDRQVLQGKGLHVIEIAQFLNEKMLANTVYTDAWGNDSSWLALLYDRAGIQPSFSLQSLRALLGEKQLEQWQLAKERVIKRLALERHRASADALILQQTYLESWHMSQA